MPIEHFTVVLNASFSFGIRHYRISKIERHSQTGNLNLSAAGLLKTHLNFQSQTKSSNRRNQMKTTNLFNSTCRYCRYYSPEGRRGGSCQKLDVPVESSWKACTLAAPPFTYVKESFEEIEIWQNSYSLDSRSVSWTKIECINNNIK